MCAVWAQRPPSRTAAPMVGESMTALTLRTWGSSAAHSGDQTPPLSPRRRPLPPPGASQAINNRGTHHRHRRSSPSPCLRHAKASHILQEATRSPSNATQHPPVAASCRRRRTATRSGSRHGIEALPEQGRRRAQRCHRGTSSLHVWSTARPTGRDSGRRRGTVRRP